MTWQKNTGRPPHTDRVRVRFRRGDESKWEYSPKQLNWSDRGEPFDIIAWKEV